MLRIYYFFLYLVKSFHLHGIHSPFVFQLTNDVLREKAKYYAYDEVESLRAKLLLTEKTLSVQDLGAGKKESYQKSISKICKGSSQTAAFGQIIHRIARESKAKSILELGTSLGLTTSYLGKACPDAKIISIEGSAELSKVADINLKKLNILNVKLVVDSFENALLPSLKELEKVDLVYFDGNHDYQATMDYFESCLPYSHDKTVFIFDDIYWSAGMKRAWKEICSHSSISSSIDLFKIGIVYLDPKLAKQNITVYHSANFNLS